MRITTSLLLMLPVAVAISLAGPPAGGHASSGGGGGGGHVASHSFSGGNTGVAAHYGPPASVSGPPPLGASGPPPLNATGNLHPVYGGGSQGYRGPGNGHHGGGERNPGNGHRNRYAYGYLPFYSFPYYGYGDDYGYSDSGDYGPGPEYGPGGGDPQGSMANQDALGQQVQQLTAEIEDMKSQQQVQQAPPQPQAAPGNTAAAQPADSDVQNDVPITLVLRSGQELNVKNYAVTAGTFWDFSKHPAQKIPVSTIDLAASEKATAANGGDFPAIGH